MSNFTISVLKLTIVERLGEKSLGYSHFGNIRLHTTYIIILSPVFQKKPSLLVRLATKSISS